MIIKKHNYMSEVGEVDLYFYVVNNREYRIFFVKKSFFFVQERNPLIVSEFSADGDCDSRQFKEVSHGSSKFLLDFGINAKEYSKDEVRQRCESIVLEYTYGEIRDNIQNALDDVQIEKQNKKRKI